MDFEEYLKENGYKVFGVMVLLVFVIAISGCTTSNNNHFSGKTISFDYPKNWTQIENSGVLALVVDQNKNSTGAWITSPPTDLGSGSGFTVSVTSDSLEGTVEIFGKTLTKSGFKIVSQTPTRVDNLNAIQLNVTYKNSDNQDMKGTHTIIEKNKNETYYDIFTFAQTKDFEQNKQNFEMILNSFKC